MIPTRVTGLSCGRCSTARFQARELAWRVLAWRVLMRRMLMRSANCGTGSRTGFTSGQPACVAWSPRARTG